MGILSEIMSQTDKSARLLERAQKACENVRGLRSGDRVYTPLIASAEFAQGNAPSANLVFNVPADADFWAYRLLFYPYCKVIDPVNGSPDELVFRPASFTGEAGAPGLDNVSSVYTDYSTSVDGTFGLIFDGQEMQNIDTPLSAAYCANMGKWLSGFPSGSSPGLWAGSSDTPGGYVFPIPHFMPRAKSLVCRVTPTYLGVRTITEQMAGEVAPTTITRQHRYKIVAVLEGEKKVAAFR